MLTHKELGADMFRYNWNYGKNLPDWTAYEDVTAIPGSEFNLTAEMLWDGQHIIV
jgi:alpha-1,3-glucan synthase